MKHTIIKILSFVLLLSSGTACLEKYPTDAIPGREAITSVDVASQVVTAIYASFKSSALYSGNLTLLPDIQTDLVQAVEGYSNQLGNIWRWEILSTDREIEAVYGSLYGVIGQCNYFFDCIADLEASLTDDDEISELESLKGEVHFARALAYSELIKCFCKDYDPDTAGDELGVVLVSSYYNPGRMVRATLKDSYDFVLSDLEKASDMITLDETNNSSYFTKSTVNALYARVYLYMRDWEKAAEYATKVIDDENLALSSTNNNYVTSEMSDYQYMWNYDAGTEVIWKVGMTTTSYGGALGQRFLGYNYSAYYPDYVPADPILELYDDNDLRASVFFATVQTGYPHHLTCPLLIKYYGNPTFLSVNIRHVNMPKVFRLSEQYLIRSEAYCRLDRFSEATDDLTTLRRARYSSYAEMSLNAGNWEQTILDERARELYMEGFRLQDLKRFHRGFEREEQLNTVSSGNTLKIEADNPLFVWPIPQHELDAPGSEILPNDSNR